MILEFGMSSTLYQKVIRIIFRNHLKFIQNILSELFFMRYLTNAVKSKTSTFSLLISTHVIDGSMLHRRMTHNDTKIYPTDHCADYQSR